MIRVALSGECQIAFVAVIPIYFWLAGGSVSPCGIPNRAKPFA
jgi:hypothetical protein